MRDYDAVQSAVTVPVARPPVHTLRLERRLAARLARGPSPWLLGAVVLLAAAAGAGVVLAVAACVGGGR